MLKLTEYVEDSESRQDLKRAWSDSWLAGKQHHLRHLNEPPVWMASPPGEPDRAATTMPIS